MTEHEQLKQICDKIWYEIQFKFDKCMWFYKEIIQREIYFYASI